MVNYNGCDFNQVFGNKEFVVLFTESGHQGGVFKGRVVERNQMWRHINLKDGEKFMWYSKVLSIPDDTHVWHNEDNYTFYVNACYIEPAKYMYYEYENFLSAMQVCNTNYILDNGPLTYQMCMALNKYAQPGYYKRFMKKV